jgi:hypothetical protein
MFSQYIIGLPRLNGLEIKLIGLQPPVLMSKFSKSVKLVDIKYFGFDCLILLIDRCILSYDK